jgi:hypothetical protein
MSQTNFYGRLVTGDLATVRQLLQTWLGTEQLAEKLKLSGDQLVYEDERVYVYASAAMAAVPAFLLEGHVLAGLDEARTWLQRLLAGCVARGVDAALEYVAVDGDGQEISEQHAVTIDGDGQLHPGANDG